MKSKQERFLKIQKEHKIWQTYNFGKVSSNQCRLGVIEEIGELAHAELKIQQGIRGSKEDHIEEIKDALGDICIYLCGYLSALSKSINVDETANLTTIAKTENEILIFELTIRTGLPADSLKSSEHFIYLLELYAVNYGLNLIDIVEETWSRVKTRDWTKNKQTGE